MDAITKGPSLQPLLERLHERSMANVSEEKQTEQPNLFGFEEPWKDEWKGMPEFVQDDLAPFKSVIVHFSSFENAQKFAKLVEQTITMDTQSLWYPEEDFIEKKNRKYIQEP